MPPPQTVWEQWNIALFLALRATANSPHELVATAVVLTELPLLVALVLAAWQLLRSHDGVGALRVALACAIALAIEALVSAVAFHPRPFAAGFGPAWVAHAANNSMPSTHATLAWAMALTIALRGHYRTGVALFVLGGLLAWARIYVGIHWPADMVGAAVSAGLSVALAWLLQRVGLAILIRHRQADQAARDNAHLRNASPRSTPPITKRWLIPDETLPCFPSPHRTDAALPGGGRRRAGGRQGPAGR